LVEKGFAYEEEGEIFFHVGESKDYGKLSGQNLEKLKSVQKNISLLNYKDLNIFLIFKHTNSNVKFTKSKVLTYF